MIEIKNLYKSYGSLEVLKDISFKIEKGDIFGIIGQSGAGKSTLLRCFNGLENFQKGEVIVDGQAISSLNKKQMSNIQKPHPRSIHILIIINIVHFVKEYFILHKKRGQKSSFYHLFILQCQPYLSRIQIHFSSYMLLFRQ